MKAISLIFILFLSFNLNAAVWDNFNQWDDNWEQQYSTWVTEKWVVDIFSNQDSPYYDIATDCADASYAMRAIFAFENNLPFAVHDSTRVSSKKPMSNSMKRFDQLPAGFERLKAFIGLLSAVLNTANLSTDTVPVAITKETLIPGTIYVKPYVHSYQIVRWLPEGFPETINSTTPYSVKVMHNYISFPSYIPLDVKRFTDGYRRFKRPNELYLPTSSLKGFSVEQFTASKNVDFNPILFNNILMEKTRTRVESTEQKVRRLMFNICYANYNRVNAIDESTNYYNKLLSKGRQCMNAQEFDQYSTFTRDKRLKEYFVKLKAYLDETGRLQRENFPLKRYALDLFNDNPSTYQLTREKYLKFCTVPYKQDGLLTIREVWQRIKAGKLVQNPNTTNDWRWGDYATPFQTSCPTFEEIH